MRRIILIVALLAGLIFSTPVHAQSTVVMDDLEIGLWPEYDRADVLVIYRITLASSVSLPAQMSVRIPRAAGNPYNLAMKEVDGLLYNLSYTSDVQSEWTKLTFTTPSANVQIEYYDPGLTKTDSKRQFEYVWNGDFTVNHLSVVVQQPANASDMRILPDFGSGSPGDDGLTYFTKDVGSVNAGTTFTVGFTYSKPDDSLSLGSQSVQPVQAITNTPAGRISASDFLPYVLGGVGLILVVGGLVWFIVSRNRSNGNGSGYKRRHRAAQERAAVPAGGEEPLFCSKCGRRASPTDVFCRSCGNRVRTS